MEIKNFLKHKKDKNLKILFAIFIFTLFLYKVIYGAGSYISLLAYFPTSGSIQSDGAGPLETYDIDPGGTYGPVQGTLVWSGGFTSPLPAMGMGKPGLGYMPSDYPLGCEASSNYPGSTPGNSGVPTGFGGYRICEIAFNTPIAGSGTAYYTFYASPDAVPGTLYLIGLTSNGGSNTLEKDFYLRIRPKPKAQLKAYWSENNSQSIEKTITQGQSIQIPFVVENIGDIGSVINNIQCILSETSLGSISNCPSSLNK